MTYKESQELAYGEERRITYEEMLMFCTIHREQIFVHHLMASGRFKNLPISKVPFGDVITYMQTWYDDNKFPYRVLASTKVKK